MIGLLLRWLITLAIAFIVGKLMAKIKMPSILGWLIVGMLLGPHAIGLMPQEVLSMSWYRTIIMWMQCAFGVMLGTELIWKKLKNYGKALVVTTLTQSLGTFAVVSLAFGLIFAFRDVPVWLAFVFGGIALATAPAPALSIEFAGGEAGFRRCSSFIHDSRDDLSAGDHRRCSWVPDRSAAEKMQ